MADLDLAEPLPHLSDDELTFSRLSVEQQAQMYAWLEAGKLTHGEIAEQLGCSRPNVSYHAKRFGLSPKLLLRSQGVAITRSWLRAIPVAEAKGDSRPMERALLYGGHLEPLQADGGQRVVVQIGVQLGFGQPVEPAPGEPTTGIVVAIASTVPTEPT